MWDEILSKLQPRRILEIGSFEGLSTTYLIAKCTEYNPVEIHCVDTWAGGIEHEGIDFSEVEQRFNTNVQLTINNVKSPVTVFKHKGKSLAALSELTAKERSGFDLVYVDGSHESPDVIADAVLGWELLRIGGAMVFDDYNNPNPHDDPKYPRLAIDSFLKIFHGRYKEVSFSSNGVPIEQMYQLFLQKIA